MDRLDRQSIFEIGDRMWDLPRLRTLLENVRDQDSEFQDLEVTQTIPQSRSLLFTARRVRDNLDEHSILLAIQDTPLLSLWVS